MIGFSRVYATGYVSQGHAVMCASYCWLLAWYMFTCWGLCSCSLMCLCVLCVAPSFWLIENHTQKMTTWSYILGLRLVNIYWLSMVTVIHVSNFSCSKFPCFSMLLFDLFGDLFISVTSISQCLCCHQSARYSQRLRLTGLGRPIDLTTGCWKAENGKGMANGNSWKISENILESQLSTLD